MKKIRIRKKHSRNNLENEISNMITGGRPIVPESEWPEDLCEEADRQLASGAGWVVVVRNSDGSCSLLYGDDPNF